MLFWYLAIVQIEDCPECFSLKFWLMSQLLPLITYFDFLLDEVLLLSLFFHLLKLLDSLLMLLHFAPAHKVFDKLTHFWLNSWEWIWTLWVLFVRRICIRTKAHHFFWSSNALLMLTSMRLCVAKIFLGHFIWPALFVFLVYLRVIIKLSSHVLD